MISEIVFSQLMSRYQLEEYLLYLSSHPGEFPELLNSVVEFSCPKAAFRSLWACEKVSQRWPEWYSDEHRLLIREMVVTTRHTGMLRLGLSILNSLPIPEDIDVELINILYNYMLDASFPPGVQCQAIRLLHAHVKHNPDLLYEFWLVLDEAANDFHYPAFRSTRKNLMKGRR
jgi:hypothetical protein